MEASANGGVLGSFFTELLTKLVESFGTAIERQSGSICLHETQ